MDTKSPVRKEAESDVVDDALREVLDEIERGSALGLRPQARARLRELYYPDFYDRLVVHHVDWSQARLNILPKAFYVGVVALMLTVHKSILSAPGATIPSSIEEAEAVNAALAVACITLDSEIDICPEGKFCQSLCTDTGPGRRAAASLRAFVDHLEAR